MNRAQQTIKRFFGQQSFADNSRLVFDLPRDYDLNSLVIQITANANITTAFTTVRAEAPLQAVKFLTLKANGTDVLDGLSGIMAHRMGAFRRGQLPLISPPGAVSVGAQAFSAFIVLDRDFIDGIRAKDGSFPTAGLSSFQLELQMGACADLFTGAGVGTFTAGTVKVFGIQTEEIVGADGKRTLPHMVFKRTQSTIPFANTVSGFQQRLNTGNAVRGLMLRAYGVTADEPSNAVLTNLKIQRGNQIWFDLSGDAIRNDNATSLEITTLPTGIYIVDFANKGGMAVKGSDFLDMRDGEDLYAMFDVTGGANVKIDVAMIEAMPYAPRYWGLIG